ncbi:poly-gamma-glutamate hydrolase family protein [Natronorubrum halophilum]|uniref:poly-gamma-glutamate hydrolase family protein n=1 Tax=Natronorubrum halophilum TaxID=1702106 RepID=UPI0010C17A23|nr:poly-gamma-glutamate hydrolase family protein [Natronorubrum halophilum]
MEEELCQAERTTERGHSRRRVIAAGVGIVGTGVLAAGAQTQIVRSQDELPSGTGQQAYANSCEDVDHWEVTLEEANENWSARSDPSRYCSVPCTLTNTDELTIGQQIRVGSGEAGEFENAVYTVASEHEDDTLRLTASGLDRIGASESATATIGPQAVHPGYDTRQGGELNDEYVEYVVEGDDVIVIAPHGGYIEYGTDFQATRVAEAIDGTGWICSGFNEGGGAFTRWHSYSTEIHRRSFPGLDSLLDQRFGWGVAFHGYSNGEILVGGTADTEDKAIMRDAISEQLPERTVRIVERDATEYTGANPANVLNHLATVGQTIQIEQPTDVRQSDWALVADGVTEALEEIRT